ncbi:MAG: hypothetical protein LIO91_05235 [Bacteroidales bacterium]|nr:hypothetical protein [Bacteroidales bacterium]
MNNRFLDHLRPARLTSFEEVVSRADKEVKYGRIYQGKLSGGEEVAEIEDALGVIRVKEQMFKIPGITTPAPTAASTATPTSTRYLRLVSPLMSIFNLPLASIFAGNLAGRHSLRTLKSAILWKFCPVFEKNFVRL